MVVLLSNCSKPRSVLICGDHICINKAEAEQYFEDNLTLEVRVIDKNKKKKTNLIELNLSENEQGKRKVSINSKENTKKNLKILSSKDKTKIKKKLKIKKKKKTKQILVNKVTNKNVNKNRKEGIDICTILKNCSIDEISKYLLELGKNKDFPDITKRQ